MRRGDAITLRRGCDKGMAAVLGVSLGHAASVHRHSSLPVRAMWTRRPLEGTAATPTATGTGRSGSRLVARVCCAQDRGGTEGMRDHVSAAWQRCPYTKWPIHRSMNGRVEGRPSHSQGRKDGWGEGRVKPTDLNPSTMQGGSTALPGAAGKRARCVPGRFAG